VQVLLPVGPLYFFSRPGQLYLTKPVLIRIINFIDGKFAWYFWIWKKRGLQAFTYDTGNFP